MEKFSPSKALLKTAGGVNASSTFSLRFARALHLNLS